MPCYVDFPTSEKDAHDFPGFEESNKTDSKAFKKMKKRGERAEEALCLLAREVIATQPSILIGLLLKDNKFFKTWEKHQKYDRKAGRSFYTFDRCSHLLVHCTESEGKISASIVYDESAIPKGAMEQFEEYWAALNPEKVEIKPETKPVVRVRAVGEVHPDDLTLTAAVKKLIEEHLNGKGAS